MVRSNAQRILWMLQAVTLSCAFAGASHARDAAGWLAQMSQALESRNYEGTLVHMQPGTAETFHVYHRVADGKSTERLVAMDGDGAEVVRTSDEVICIFPGQKKVVVDKRQSAVSKKGPLRANLPKLTPELAQSYEMLLLDADRVIGRPTVVISIKPLDNYRYGYRLWLDEETALPLRMQLLDLESTMPVEELFFTALTVPGVVPEEKLRSTVNTDDFAWVRHGREPGQANPPAGASKWAAADLPSGFMQTTFTLEYMADSELPRTHLVYSDGLASVSVFIDSVAPTEDKAEGFVAMGAANSYTRTHDGMLITAMGEVPARTVERIASSMELQAGQNDGDN
jgi:sigma-E factor negative regulatory protein RseB